MLPRVIYKLAPRALWTEAERLGEFIGAPIDLQDGYIHFSTSSQVAETAKRYFSGLHDIILAAIRTDGFGEELRYEPSRGGALFPHLYSSLDLKHVIWVRPVPLAIDGSPLLPELEPEE